MDSNILGGNNREREIDNHDGFNHTCVNCYSPRNLQMSSFENASTDQNEQCSMSPNEQISLLQDSSPCSVDSRNINRSDRLMTPPITQYSPPLPASMHYASYSKFTVSTSIYL